MAFQIVTPVPTNPPADRLDWSERLLQDVTEGIVQRLIRNELLLENDRFEIVIEGSKVTVTRA